MSSPSNFRLPSIGPAALIVRCAALLGAVLLLLAVVGTWKYQQHGSIGLWAATIAALVCWIGGSTALVLVGVLRGPKGVQGILGGMAFRAGLPFLVGFILQRQGGPLAEAGVFNCMLIFFLFTLVVETALAVPLLKQSTGETRKAS